MTPLLIAAIQGSALLQVVYLQLLGMPSTAPAELTGWDNVVTGWFPPVGVRQPGP